MHKIGRVFAAALAGLVGSAATAQDAVQWRVEDGGNGHWYRVVQGGPECWSDARDICIMIGGDLATAISSSERDLIQGLLIGPHWYFLGGFEEPQGNWQWISGDSIDMSLFTSGQPDNHPGQDKVAIYRIGGMHDGPACTDVPEPWNYVVEWSADCNGDGIVDYGQILEGIYADEDENGVPDCCENDCPCELDCPGDLNGDDAIGPPDLGILLALWNTDGSPNGADINDDGTVNAADLGLLIGAWGDCGCN